MVAPRTIDPQTDFSAGQINVDFKRADDKIVKAGVRQMVNWRVRASTRPEVRPGRRAAFLLSPGGRVDEIEVITSGVSAIYWLVFGNDGSFSVRNTAGTALASQGATANAWRAATIDQISWTIAGPTRDITDVVITFPGQVIRLARFDGASWTLPAFSFSVGADGHVAAPFYRIAGRGVTMSASATSGSVIVTASSLGVFRDISVIGGLIRIANRQLRITGWTSTNVVPADWLETSYAFQTITIGPVASGAAPISSFAVGQEIKGETSNTFAEIASINVGASQLHVQSLNSLSGFVLENITGPTGIAAITAITPSALEPVTTWDEQVISNANGWPGSCFTDQGRLGFTDFPAVPGAIAWSAEIDPYNFEIGAQPTDAFMDIIAGRPRAYHVLPMDGGEIVVTTHGVYSIPIDQTNPLKPGSVQFKLVTPEPAGQTRPLRVPDGAIYLSESRNRVIALSGSGATYSVKPYTVKDISEKHSALMGQIKTLALEYGDVNTVDRYLYALRTDGIIVTARYDPAREWLGWSIWNSAGTTQWISARTSTVLMVSTYPATPSASVIMVEKIEAGLYLDSAVAVNAVPPALVAPGLGPLWWAASGTVSLMDGIRPMGTYAVDATGNLIPSPVHAEDLTVATIVAGFPCTYTLEPFTPPVPGGPADGRRVTDRHMALVAVSVDQSTGFIGAKLYSGQRGANLPNYGAIMAQRRVPGYFQGDNPNVPPPLREVTEKFFFLGRSADPRFAIIKDVPGPLRVLEIGMEMV